MNRRYCDIHAHILPGIDDGSPDMETTIHMLRVAQQQGIGSIITTPHYVSGSTKISHRKRLELIQEVERRAEEEEIHIQLLEGNELYYSKGILEDLREGKASTMAGSSYVLVEFSIKTDFQSMYQAFREFLEAGYRPILAHMERYGCLEHNRERVEELIKLGVYLQMNVGSLNGGLFDKNARYCRRLLTDGYIHLIGTDTHNVSFRAPVMKDTLQKLKGKVSQELMERILYQNPERVIRNEYIN